ncbi:translocation/assembly module TamB domain-containing protein [Geothrix sp. 21YS21S-4]|uniref:translocation/assembly module TamB domain-containing protein n=1 Tax=Geothrix sp. 21YS21S-4 TaxID=3068889 RepID=UPI0027B9F095|nr:translocation/assembly module TamB domain-containing protein [Geothrix sp. 21YS21S-4]
MAWSSLKPAVGRLWSRRWVRRVSYVLVAGTGILVVAPWVATRSSVLRWAMTKLDGLVREETGLSLAIGDLELHPALGSVVVRDIRLGGDLLTIQRLELRADFASLFSRSPRIFALRADHPRLRLTEAGLAQIKLKEHPPRKGPLPQVRLDLLTLTEGDIEIPRALGTIPALHYHFGLKATGHGPNRLWVELNGPVLSIQGPAGWEHGRLDLSGEVSETFVQVQQAALSLGDSRAIISGRFEGGTASTPGRLEAHLAGAVNLAQAARWGNVPPPIEGALTVDATVAGPLPAPQGTLKVEGSDLRPAHRAFQPGRFEARASGGLEAVRVERVHWSSPQGELEAHGTWSRKVPLEASLQARGIDLEAVGQALHAPELRGVRATLDAQVQGPQDPATLARFDRWRATARAAFTQGGREAGGLRASLEGGKAVLPSLNLDLEALKLSGTGHATFGPRGLVRLDGEGRAEVNAAQVAESLRAWKIVDLDMEGPTHAQAKVRWSKGPGLELEGSVEVAAPRWHGARVDALRAQVEIRDSDLWVKGIELTKDEGRGSGDLWLTWRKTLPGESQMDMCYTAFRLPAAEGLKAADLGDLPITGTGSGWVRLQGPYDRIQMWGAAQAEAGQVYGIQVPAASSDFSMDIANLRLRLEDVRIAERPEQLGSPAAAPEGALALKGRADMDFDRRTWRVELAGRVDSQLLALPGPRIQAQVDARLLGPIVAPFGPFDLPEGSVRWSRGRIFFGPRSQEGLEGSLSLEGGRLETRLGLEGMAEPLLTARLRQEGAELVGEAAVQVSPASAHTENLARSLSEDLMEDLGLAARFQGRWNGQDLRWSGSLDQLTARFPAFELQRVGTSVLRGTAAGADVDIALEGRGRNPADAPAQAAGLRITGSLPFFPSAPLDVRLLGTANLAHLKSILDRVMEVDEYNLLSELRVEGLGRLDLRAHGTYLDPRLDGTLSLENGRANLRGYQGVEDLRADLVFKDRIISLPENNPLRGTLAHGDLRLSGDLAWRLGGLDTYTLKAALANFQLRDLPDGLDLQGTLRATLEGNRDGGLLKGRLRADRVTYQSEIKLADLILRSALSDTGGLVGLDPDDPLDRIRLDLELDLRNPWSFDTNLLKLEGRTESAFQVLGTLAHPVPKGTMVFQPGGRITNIFPAGDMVVNSGSLAFSEARPLDPMINLQGSINSIPGYTVNLDIHGTLSNLAIVPSSTPSLRQDEIVAILINPGNVANVGTAATSSGTTQGAITSGLASAGSGLISTLAFAPFQEQLRKSLGLDRVNVALRTTSLGTSETEVTFGKSFNLLGQRSAFVVSHKKSGELSITSGQVEWRFGNIILQLGASSGGGAGLNPSGEIRHNWSPR